jgi:hypothetical protein
MSRGLIVRLCIVAALAIGLPGLGAGSAAADIGTALPVPTGAAWPLPLQPVQDTNLASLVASTSSGAAAPAAQAAQGAAALAAARATGHPVVIPDLTTPTTTVTVSPDGVRTVRDYALPVRVRRHGRWVPVNTTLRRVASHGQHGMLVPTAVPGDAVAFSGGGSGPTAVISAAGAQLALRWPAPLPVPSVAGSSATYRDVLPGVDLVLTATSAAAGGFSEVLVVRSAAAARDPGLARLVFGVTARRARLVAAPGGGLYAPLTGTAAQGAFVAPAPRMWDSSYQSANGRSTARQAGSAAAGPASGARLAPVAVSVGRGGASLALRPDLALLTSHSTRFPVFIDPSFNFLSRTGREQAFDPVQSDCTGSHYNDKSDYPHSPVGFDDFHQGPCTSNGTDYSLYQIGLPTAPFASDSHILSASFEVTEVYTSSCSTSPDVTVSWIGKIDSRTGWPGPGRTADNVDVTKSFGPDPGSCNGVEDTSKRVSTGFNVEPDLDGISRASNITLRVWEKGNTNEADHKQLTDDPDLVIQYNQTPDVPSGEEQNSTNSTTGATKCDTSSSNPPVMGATASTNGPFLFATYNDPDGDSVQGTVKYWNNASPSTTHTISAGSNLTGSNGEVAAQIPASFTTGVANGTVIGWQAEAQDGSSGGFGPYTSAWSKPCYFAVYPTAPDPPTVAASASSANTGSPVTFTIAQSSGDTATQFVWALDQTPPATSPPVAQTCTTSASTTPNCVISGGKATLTITVPSPGPHDLWVYEIDAGTNSSATAMATVSGNSDPNVSYTSGSSLAANFAAALGDGKSYDNTMISNTAGASCGSGSGDGSPPGGNFLASDLTAAGWNASAPVALDGARFTVPQFGSCGPDNVLAADQTIGAGPSGAQGSSVVFLATSTFSYAEVPGLATGDPAGPLASDTTAPAVMGGTAVTGSGCSASTKFDTNQGCVPATGTINYAAGCPLTSSAYTLTVPSWRTGPTDIAALTLPNVVTASGTSASPRSLYAFAVPVDGACTISSITLPDVGPSASATLASGVTAPVPALHILGIAVRNTTTATPKANGSASASPSGSAWAGAFESPIEDGFNPPSGLSYGNQTMRIALTPQTSAPIGAQLRVRLSNPGFLATDGTGPLQVGAVTIAPESVGAVPASTMDTLKFGGSTSVNIPEGGDVYSDPLPLTDFAVTAGQPLLVSIWVKNASLPVLPENSFGTAALTWFSKSGSGNKTTDTTGTPFTGTGAALIDAVTLLSGVDVTTPQQLSGGVATSPGTPTVVVAGNNVIDGWTSSSARSDAANSPSKRLAGQLYSQGLASGFAVVDGGIEANQVLADAGKGGMSLLARLDRDVLAEPDVGTVVLDEGLEDLLPQGGGATGDVSGGLTILEEQLAAFGINVITGTLTPCYAGTSNSHTCSAAVDANRLAVNSLIMGDNNGLPYCPVDLDSAVSNGASPEALATSPTNFDAGDHVNLTFAGYAALAPAAVGSAGCLLGPPANPLSPPP